MNDKFGYETIKQIIFDILNKEKLLIGNWHLGVVDEVVSQTKLRVIVDNGTTPQLISCNPDITFNVGDNVWVIFINGNARDKFVLSRRAIVQE